MEMENNHEVKDWAKSKHILCVSVDNMGDLLMSGPAISALKETFNCKITLLTSYNAAEVAKIIPGIDEVIVADLPWVKLGDHPEPEYLKKLIDILNKHTFDGCVIFSVYSQNVLPTALMAYLAGIPLRLSYSRENPYHLLTNWVPDPEPYFYSIHQVERDLDLVRMIGAETKDKHLHVTINAESARSAKAKAKKAGIDLSKSYVILHPDASDEKRRFPEDLWISAGRLLVSRLGLQVLVTGSVAEEPLAQTIAMGIGSDAHSAAGLFDLSEFAAVIKTAQTLVSVNTATIHLAAAVNKPLVVLYARTNPQHKPWLVQHKLLAYSVPDNQRGKNQVIKYVNDQYYKQEVLYPSVMEILKAVQDLLSIDILKEEK